MMGPPGSGKTMLAKRFAGVLPKLTFREALEATQIQGVAGVLPPGYGILRQRPFRAPHHTISDAGLIAMTLSSTSVFVRVWVSMPAKNFVTAHRQESSKRSSTGRGSR